MADPALPTVKKLFTYSGDGCAFEGCESPLFDPQTGACIGVVCHIKGDRPGSPRYDPAQSDEERNGYGNLVLMCANHARVIDHRGNEVRYSAETLYGWKQAHEGTTIAPTSDAIAEALLGYSTGITTQAVTAIVSELQRHKAEADSANAAAARKAAMYREYILSNDGITPSIAAGNDPLPADWVADWQRRNPI